MCVGALRGVNVIGQNQPAEAPNFSVIHHSKNVMSAFYCQSYVKRSRPAADGEATRGGRQGHCL